VACTTLHPFSVSGHCEDLPWWCPHGTCSDMQSFSGTPVPSALPI
jgi:hypothetical protein